MKTIFLQQPNLLRLAETEPPAQPGPNQALVRVHRVGICGTDLHAFRGRQPFFTYPRILGHELGCEVIALGQGTGDINIAAGDRCAVEPYLNCGHCIACRRGKSNCCVNLQVLGVHIDGGMRELITVPVAKLHRSPRLSLDQLALVEPLCIGAHAIRRAQLEPEEVVLVIGAGPIGLATIQAALLVGARLIVMEVNHKRAEFCRRQLGVEVVIDGNHDPLLQLQEILDGELPTAVFDATGNAQSMMNAIQYVAHGGKLIFVGFVQDDLTFNDPEFHKREMTIIRSRNATPDDFAWVIDRLETGKIDPIPWITHRTSAEAIIAEFAGWLEPETGVIKAMLAL